MNSIPRSEHPKPQFRRESWLKMCIRDRASSLKQVSPPEKVQRPRVAVDEVFRAFFVHDLASVS